MEYEPDFGAGYVADAIAASVRPIHDGRSDDSTMV